MSEGDDSAVGMSIKDALKEVLKESLKVDGLARGLREAVKALDKRGALLCILAENCSEAAYVRLIKGLCNEHQIPLMKVERREELGEWAGLCKIDKDGKPRKTVKCSCVVVKDVGTDTEAWSVVQEYVKAKGGLS